MAATTRASPAQIARFRALKKKPGETKSKSNRPRTWPEKRLIDAKYESPEPGIHILEVPCFLPGTNEVYSWLRYGQSWLVDKHKKAARNAVLGCLTRSLPEWCVDISDEARATGNAKRQRDAVNFMVLSRISPGFPKNGKVIGLDDDNNIGALKGVRDTVCAWLANGPVFDTDNIGDYDEMIYHPQNNPSGRIQLAYVQDIRPATPGSRVDGKHIPRNPGHFGCKIELHQR